MHVIQPGIRQGFNIRWVQIIAIGVDHQSGIGQCFSCFPDAIQNSAICQRFIVAVHYKVLVKADFGQVIQHHPPDRFFHAHIFAKPVAHHIRAIGTATIAIGMGFNLHPPNRAGKVSLRRFAVRDGIESCPAKLHRLSSFTPPIPSPDPSPHEWRATSPWARHPVPSAPPRHVPWCPWGWSRRGGVQRRPVHWRQAAHRTPLQ